MSANQFDNTLRELIQKKPFAPFWVQLKDGQRIHVQKPVLAFGGGAASFIDPDDGTLVGFSHEQVIGFHSAGQEVGA